MEALVQEKILSSFVNEASAESATIQPINIDINRTNVTRMVQNHTMISNDKNYFIRYGGFVTSNSYNAIEVYSANSLDNNNALYVFDNLKIDNHSVQIRELKQAEDGRFYGIGQYLNNGTYSYYLLILNNFIQDGYCKINKYYTEINMGLNVGAFQYVAKVPNTGIYFIVASNTLIKFEINVLEGNKINTATIIDGGTITDGYYTSQLNVLKNKLVFTKLWETDDHQIEYTKAVIDINEELPASITLNRIHYMGLQETQYISGITNEPYEAIIPFLNVGKIQFNRIDLNGNVKIKTNFLRTFNDNSSVFAYLKENYASVTDNNNIYLFFYDNTISQGNLIEFYSGTFNGSYFNTQILKQNNIVNLIGVALNGEQQSIVSIKNIYSPNVTSQPYFKYDFCLPYYMNLYSNSNDNTSLIFSRDATARFFSGNQITSTFIVPNYLLNDGNIEKASVYGKTNYLLNSEVEDYQKNRFESLYFNFIYNLNVIDNTNGLNASNQIGSNKVANGLWKTFDNYDLRLTKARITYEDLSTEIINLNIPTVTGDSVTFNFEVSGNITKIEYLSNDESVVYATFKTNLTGTNTITQTIRVE